VEQIRSFIAIELPDELKAEIKRVQAKLKSDGEAGVKWVDPRGIHLTLKFLGDVAADRIDEITGAIRVAVQGISPFRLEVKGLGVFPNLNRVRVVWVGLSGELDKLIQLARSIETNVSPLGFPTESREFTPHLTLARVGDRVPPDERQQLGQLIASTKFEAKSAIEVKAINLMKSQLTPQGAIYSRLNSVELKS